MTGAAAGQHLPPPDRRVEIGGVELDTAAAPAGALGRDYRRAAAEKGVEDDLAAGRAVEDCIGDHRHRLDGRVPRQKIALGAVLGKGVGPGISPQIAAVTPEAAE